MLHDEEMLGAGWDIRHRARLVGSHCGAGGGGVGCEKDRDGAGEKPAIEHLRPDWEFCQKNAESVVLPQVLLVEAPGRDRERLQLILRQ